MNFFTKKLIYIPLNLGTTHVTVFLTLTSWLVPQASASVPAGWGSAWAPATRCCWGCRRPGPRRRATCWWAPRRRPTWRCCASPTAPSPARTTGTGWPETAGKLSMTSWGLPSEEIWDIWVSTEISFNVKNYEIRKFHLVGRNAELRGSRTASPSKNANRRKVTMRDSEPLCITLCGFCIQI